MSINSCSAMQENLLEAQIAQYRAKHAQAVRLVEQSEGNQVVQGDKDRKNKIHHKILLDHHKTLILKLRSPELSQNKEQAKEIVQSEVANLKRKIKREKRSSKSRKKLLNTLKKNKRKLEAFIDEQEAGLEQEIKDLNESFKKQRLDDDEIEELDEEMFNE